MTLIRWKPVREVNLWSPVNDLTNELFTMQREIDHMFDRFRGGSVENNANLPWSPVVDIAEEKDQYIVRAELPGVDKNDVKITVENNLLSIRGEKKIEAEKEGKNYHRVERSYGSFFRSFTLPSTVESNKIEATYSDGVLSLSIPKAVEAKPKEIEVKIK